MAEDRRPESILDMLTMENPSVGYGKMKSRTLTQSPFWWTPQQLRPWTEFSYETLGTVFDGRLLEFAQEKRRQLPCHPHPHPRYCKVAKEAVTRDLIMKWNHTIVSTALELTDPEFSPTFWVGDVSDSETDKDDQGNNQDDDRPPKKKLQKTMAKKKKEKKWLFPDGGAEVEKGGGTSRGERLPKDYKAALKWHSQMVFEDDLLDEDGMWKKSSSKLRMAARPIRQVYTYCVNTQCRYGCILTTEEIFIVRIGPRIGAKRHLTTGNTTQTEPGDLKKLLKKNGLMEYISIPWGNHNNGDCLNYKQLTINLATWFIHILAGNNHEIDWWHPALRLTGSTWKRPVADMSQEPSSRPIKYLPKKRRREEDTEETIYHSFLQHQPLVMKVCVFQQLYVNNL
ncbi:hypothetical protein F4777DRAFT_291699 [Nemania sp. FL0916]|nr:hypothetical protein F4777DRAFT_291699 [Nemania sp. FL0916]